MRLQDKLLRLHRAHAHGSFRRYLVREMDRLVAGLDSEQVVDFLLERFPATEAGEGVQARVTFARFLPRHILRLHGPPRRLRSVVLGPGEAGEAADAPDSIPPAELARLAAGARAIALERLPSLPPAPRARVISALAPFPGTAIDDALRDLALADDPDPFAAFILARRGGDVWNEAIPRLAARSRDFPELLVVLTAGAAPGTGPSPLVERAIEIAGEDPYPAALAMEGVDPEHRGRIFKQIVATRRGWAIVQALASLSRTGDEHDLDSILWTLSRFDHPILRAEAARSLGRIAGDRARAACARLIADAPSGVEAAAALDSLVRQGVPDADRARLFGMAAASRSPEVLALACLGRLELDPGRAAEDITRLLTGDANARRHGLHALAYLPGLEAGRLLTRHMLEDPEADLRRFAAILAGYRPPSQESSILLEEALERCGEEALPFVARAAVLAADPPDGALAGRLERRLDAAVDPSLRRELMRDLARTGLAEAKARVEATLAAPGGGREVVLGALEGAGASAIAWSGLDLARWVDGPDAELAAAAVIALVPEDPARAARSIERLVAGDDVSFSHGILALESLAHIARGCADHPRYVHWMEAIRRSGDRPVASGVHTGPAALAIEPARRLAEGADRAAAIAVARRIQGGWDRPAPRRTRLEEPVVDPRGLETVGRSRVTLAVIFITVFVPALLFFQALLAPAAPDGAGRPARADFATLEEGELGIEGTVVGKGALVGLPATLGPAKEAVRLLLPSSQARLALEPGCRFSLRAVQEVGPGRRLVHDLHDMEGVISVTVPQGSSQVRLFADGAALGLGPGEHRIESRDGRTVLRVRKGRSFTVEVGGAARYHDAPRRLELRGGRVVDEGEDGP